MPQTAEKAHLKKQNSLKLKIQQEFPKVEPANGICKKNLLPQIILFDLKSREKCLKMN